MANLTIINWKYVIYGVVALLIWLFHILFFDVTEIILSSFLLYFGSFVISGEILNAIWDLEDTIYWRDWNNEIVPQISVGNVFLVEMGMTKFRCSEFKHNNEIIRRNYTIIFSTVLSLGFLIIVAILIHFDPIPTIITTAIILYVSYSLTKSYADRYGQNNRNLEFEIIKNDNYTWRISTLTDISAIETTDAPHKITFLEKTSQSSFIDRLTFNFNIYGSKLLYVDLNGIEVISGEDMIPRDRSISLVSRKQEEIYRLLHFWSTSTD